MQPRNDSFPFMSDNEVSVFNEALSLPESEHSEDHKKAISQERNQADLLTLWELMEKLREGHVVSDRLAFKLEELYAVTDAERLTA